MSIKYPNFILVENQLKSAKVAWLEKYKEYNERLVTQLSADSGRSACHRIFFLFLLIATILTTGYFKGKIALELYLPIIISVTIIQFVIRVAIYAVKMRPYKERCQEAQDALFKQVIQPAHELGWVFGDDNILKYHESEKLLLFLKKLKEEGVENVRIVKNIVKDEYYVVINENNIIGTLILADSEWIDSDALCKQGSFTFMENMKLE